MLVVLRLRIVLGLLLLGLGVGTLGVQARAQTAPPPEPQAPPPLDGPAIGVEALPAAESPRGRGAFGEDRTRETPRESSPAPGVPADSGRVYVPKAPPEPIAERPSGNRPGLGARWIAGYWDWDPARSDFVWVGGSWRIPPPGSIWVAGRWMRDPGGWYWVPGSWSRRLERAAVSATGPALRATGPPADHPDDTPAPAPGPDFFFVPGHYTPSRDRLAWTSGFWARVQPGWDWIPARWIRRPDGWEFRDGYWAPDPGTAVITTNTRRRVVARPGPSGLPPAIIDSERGPGDTDVGTDSLPPPPGAVTGRDPIAEAEASGRLVGPVTGMPYYVIRPPGTYPYGPQGVVVPGAVPPFVRRILDRVLP